MPNTGGQAGADRAGWLAGARRYLGQADPVLAGLIADRPDFDPRQWMSELPPMDLFGALLFQITGQQLAGRLSDGRLEPEALATLADDELIAVLTEIPGIGPWTLSARLTGSITCPRRTKY